MYGIVKLGSIIIGLGISILVIHRVLKKIKNTKVGHKN